MIFNLFAPYADSFPLFNLIRYTTFRAGAACLTALVLSLALGPTVIRWLRGFQLGAVSTASNYSQSKARVLGNVEIMDYFIDRLETLHPRLKKTEMVATLLSAKILRKAA